MASFLDASGVNKLWQAIKSNFASKDELNKKADTISSRTTIYVAKTGNDDSGDGSLSAPYLTITKAVSIIPKLITERVLINIGEGTYDEDVSIEGFCGRGIHIDGATGATVNVKSIFVNQCAFGDGMQIKNINLTGVTSRGYGWSLYITSCSYVYLDTINCVGAVSSQNYGAITFHMCGTVIMRTCVISNKQVALDLGASSVYLNNTVTGENNTTSIRCGSAWVHAGGFVQKGGATIAGSESKAYGGQIF